MNTSKIFYVGMVTGLLVTLGACGGSADDGDSSGGLNSGGSAGSSGSGGSSAGTSASGGAGGSSAGQGGTAGSSSGGSAGGNEACTAPQEVGSCEAAIPRWWHDPATGACEEFTFGGCEGNANNYETKEACEESCGGTSGGDLCELPADSGPCLAAMPRYFHNAETGACELFTYGGCGGNENNFQSAEECVDSCGGELDICQLAPEVGPCDAAIAAWYFNPQTGDCEEFTYGGCEGNENNFESKSACLSSCGSGGSGDACTAPAETGPCDAAFQRYFFNTATGQCEEFLYGGCGGNDNNYESLEACQKSCG